MTEMQPSSRNHCEPCQFGQLPAAKNYLMSRIDSADVRVFAQIADSPNRSQIEESLLDVENTPPIVLARHEAAPDCEVVIFEDKCDSFRSVDVPGGVVIS